MYIVRKLTLLITAVLLVSCANYNMTTLSKNPCIETRAALDIGSGTTKLVVADVDTCSNSIVGVLFEAHRVVAFKESLQRSKSNSFSSTITNKAISQLRDLLILAKQQGAERVRAVATSAFRTASNAKETADIIKKTINLPIKIITQTDEALFAYNSAVSKAKQNGFISAKDTKIAVWDIGGGSMQIVKKSKDENIIYLGKLASVSFKNKVLKKFLRKRRSPNPLKKDNAVNAMGLARTYSNSHARPLLGSLKGYKVIGAGGVHFFSVKNQIGTGFNYYDRGELLETLLSQAKLSDKQVGGKYAQTDVTNLALVLGFMQSLSIEKVTPLKINMAHGVLTSKSLWK